MCFLLQDGKINLWRDGEVSALETEPELEPVLSVRLETGSVSVDGSNEEDKEEKKEPEHKLLCLVETGLVYRVSYYNNNFRTLKPWTDLSQT